MARRMASLDWAASAGRSPPRLSFSVRFASRRPTGSCTSTPRIADAWARSRRASARPAPGSAVVSSPCPTSSSCSTRAGESSRPSRERRSFARTTQSATTRAARRSAWSARRPCCVSSPSRSKTTASSRQSRVSSISSTRRTAECSRPELDPLGLAFQLKLLWLSGYLPHVGSCAECGAEENIVGYSPRAGGAVCVTCAADALTLSAEGLAAVDALLRQPLADAAGMSISERAARDALTVVSSSYEFHGGFRLRTLSA